MNIGESLSAARLKQISSLSAAKHREELGQTIVEGLRSVRSALQGGDAVVEIVLTSEAADKDDVVALLTDVDIPIRRISARDFARVSDVKTGQGVLAVIRTQWKRPGELTAMKRVVAMDGVQDPGNVGTIVRAASWFGIQGVLAGPGTADLFSPKVLRATMGGTWDLSVARCPNLAEALLEMKKSGHRIVGADMEGTNISSWRPHVACVLVVGNEGSGMSAGVRNVLDDLVSVPRGSSAQSVESLNVGVASAVIMHRWSREWAPS